MNQAPNAPAQSLSHGPAIAPMHDSLGCRPLCVSASLVAISWIALGGGSLPSAGCSSIRLCGIRLSGLGHSEVGLSGGACISDNGLPKANKIMNHV